MMMVGRMILRSARCRTQPAKRRTCGGRGVSVFPMAACLARRLRRARRLPAAGLALGRLVAVRAAGATLAWHGELPPEPEQHGASDDNGHPSDLRAHP